MTTIAQDTVQLTVQMPAEFRFKPGQYITLELADVAFDNPREAFRDFSISSSPDQLPLLSVAFRTGRSLFKKTLTSLKPGADILVGGPKGVFLVPASGSVTMIAGGIGITPFISMLDTKNHFQKHPASSLYYFNRDAQHVAFLPVLQAPHDTMTIQAHGGQASVANIPEAELNDQHRTWFISGPPAMVETVLQSLMDKGVQPERIRTEEFSGYV